MTPRGGTARTVAVVLAALALTPIVASSVAEAQRDAADRTLPGAYPAPLVRIMEGLVDGAEEAAWPHGRGVHEDAADELAQAVDALDRGRLHQALEAYDRFRTENAVAHLLDELEGLRPGRGRDTINNATSQFRAEARAAIGAGRDVVNGLDIGALSLSGIETGLWGALEIGRAELSLNSLDAVGARDLYADDTVDEALLRAQVALTFGSATRASVGATIASAAPLVRGPAIDEANATERLERIASRRLQISGQPDWIEYVPRGDAERDNAIMRAGLLMVSAEQSKAQDFQRLYVEAAGRRPLTRDLAEAYAADREALAPWAATGSPLALHAWEKVDLDEPEEVRRSQLSPIVQARSTARTVIDTQSVLHPDPPALESPGLGAITVLLVAIAAATCLAGAGTVGRRD